jgi:FixJ family two-component response regulator
MELFGQSSSTIRNRLGEVERRVKNGERSEKLPMPGIPLISIVDDDDALRSSLEDLIRSVGFRVQGFVSAEAFLRSDQVQKTDCLILDLRMPGMTGLGLQRHLRSESPDLPIIFITAYEDRYVQAQAFEAGAVAFLYKPVYEQDLLSAIDAALKHG